VTWRLPVLVLTRVYARAQLEGTAVTAWVERALLERLNRPLR